MGDNQRSPSWTLLAIILVWIILGSVIAGVILNLMGL